MDILSKSNNKKFYSRKEVLTIIAKTIDSIRSEKELGLLTGITRDSRVQLSEHDKGFNRAKKLLLKALLQAF